MLEGDQQNEEIFALGGESSKQNVRRSTRTKSKSIRLTSYESFKDQAIDAYGDLIEGMMMADSEPINLDQAMNDYNWLVAIQEELIEVQRNKT